VKTLEFNKKSYALQRRCVLSAKLMIVSDLHKSILKKAKKNSSTAIMFVMASREASLIGNRNRLCSSYIALKKSIHET
jgi:hypothetical protein|tara:strand:+ start:1828 stop:2061 length:234 start_codon:yes stop_codon:yes gene_type:complete